MGRPSKTTEEIDKFIVDTVEENQKLVPKLVQKAVLAKYNFAGLVCMGESASESLF